MGHFTLLSLRLLFLVGFIISNEWMEHKISLAKLKDRGSSENLGSQDGPQSPVSIKCIPLLLA